MSINIVWRYTGRLQMAMRAMQWTRRPRCLISSVIRHMKIIVSKVLSVALFQISVVHNIDVGAFSQNSTSHEIFCCCEKFFPVILYPNVSIKMFPAASEA